MAEQPQDQLSVLKAVTDRLDTAAIPYMITGSIAAGHYGYPRMTRDIDLVAKLEPVDATRLASALGDDFGADAETIYAAISRQGIFNVIHVEAIVKVDFVVLKHTPFRLEEFSRRRPAQVDGHPIWIVSPEDLILSKLVWAKESRSELPGGRIVNDTSPEAAAKLDALLARRSGSDRVRMACDMFDLARALAVAGIRADEPTINREQLRARLFDRLYGDDFSEEERARIIATLR